MKDLIDRQDAKDVVDMELDAIDHVPEWVYDRLLTALDKVPSAQPEGRSGVFIPDITVKNLRKAPLEAVGELLVAGEMEDIVLPSVQPETQKLLDDGTLIVHTDVDIIKITRVNITQNNTHYGGLFYPDEE